jgi:hypothetical protein
VHGADFLEGARVYAATLLFLSCRGLPREGGLLFMCNAKPELGWFMGGVLLAAEVAAAATLSC